MKQSVISHAAIMGTEQRISLAEERHRALDSRLKELGRRAYLTPAEQIEATELKKKKLLAKDEIASLRRRSP